MGIRDEDVARVREATDIVALVSEHVGLRRVGRRHQGLCPFHTEKTASFSVNPELGLYHCFGCGAGGDAIAFVREIEHLDFVGALERLASRAGVTLTYDDDATSSSRRRHDRLVAAVAAAVGLYHEWLLRADDAGTARRYLRGRGIGGDVVRTFSLGWAPDGFDALSRRLSEDGFSRQDLLDAGLCFVNRVGKLQDHFRDRVMFPIFDVRGDPVGFGGRVLAAGAAPKYKNSPESALYHKSRVLYGLNWAKGDIVARREVVVCEGYTDVIAFFGAGVPRAVATCGTALGEDHLKALRNFAPRVVLAYDADAAGQSAALRIYQWEDAYQLSLLVADLPAGADPADVAHADPDRLGRAVTGARPFLRFRLDRLLAAAELVTAEGRATVARAAVALIAEHPNDLVRDQYLMGLSEQVRIDVDRLRAAVAEAIAARSDPTAATAGGPGGRTQGGGGNSTRSGAAAGERARAPNGAGLRRRQARDRNEIEALRVAVHEPALVADRLEVAVFADPVAAQAFSALAESATFHDALERCDGPAGDLLRRLAVEDLPWGDDPGGYATTVVVQMLEAAATRRLRELVAAGEDRASELKTLLETLVTSRSAGTWGLADRAAAQLLPWVAGGGEE